jgi:predicted DNA-binding protein (MmcQ/YjbR family)
MTRDEFDSLLRELPSCDACCPVGDASVWKVGGKVFAIGGWSETPEFAATFKCSETSFLALKDLPSLRPAPYLASRGLTWIQRTDARTLSDGELADYVRQSYAVVSMSLPRKTRRELGLNQD